MAAGRLALMFLLLLPLHLSLCWDRDPQGDPVAKDEISSKEMAETAGPWKPYQGNSHVRLPRALVGPCQLWSLTLPVAELGLGYASEEKVIFRYCAGSCLREAHTQHSLVLARLRGQGRAHGQPCCQPTSYTDVTFLDDRHRWQQLPQLSAAACGCGG
ncbi:persephin [Phodopus roborovskii]|uniref:Persephin n=1 Tax=Phodopus roborovskii TaxID=109678 RepID=A0AAU9YW58_PHORO|nr:persephin [Phodopus roborovskii]CAH6779476.1 Pspn [Phodopus roborovskii]